MPHGERVAEFLLSIGAVKLQPHEPFTWTSGMKSPMYCDCRMIFSHPDARDVIAGLLASHVKSMHVPPDAIAGTATAAIGWAALVADRLKLPFVYVRNSAKEHGTKNMIEGEVKKGSHVIVIEDVISTGGSAMSTVRALRDEAEASVSDVISILSYEFLAAREAAMEHTVRIHPLTTTRVLVDVAVNQDRIEDEDRTVILDFLKDPEGWGRRR